MKIQVTLLQKGTLEKIEGTNLWNVVTPYIWEIRNGKVREVKVPKGFVTDFGSIPRPLWIFLNPTEYHSYILHDYLYKNTILTRKLSDLSLQIGLLSEGAYGLEAYTVWVGVRLGGWIYYNSHIIWSFSSWKTKVESQLEHDNERIHAIEALDIGVELAKINTTLKHIEQLLTKK